MIQIKKVVLVIFSVTMIAAATSCTRKTATGCPQWSTSKETQKNFKKNI